MRIRLKAALIVAGTLVTLTALVVALVGGAIFRDSRQNESELAASRTERAYRALLNEIEFLDRTTVDYASWDDTYAYVEDRNPEFIAANLSDDTFVKNRFGFVLIADTNGVAVFAKSYDLRAGTAIPFSASLQDLLRPGQALLLHANTLSSKSGLVMTRDGPFLVGSRPVLTGRYEGPIRGTLLIGRFFDSCEISNLVSVALLPIAVLPLDSPELPDGLVDPTGADPVLPRVLNNTTIAGYRLVRDFAGAPALVLRVTSDRTFTAQARASLRMLVLVVLTLVLVAILLSLVLLDRLVLSRVAALHDFAQALGTSRGLSDRFVSVGHDELAGLGNAFNAMLDRVQQAIETRQKAEVALTESERVFYTLLSNLRGMAYRCRNDTEWTMTFVSDGSRDLTGYAPSDLVDNRTVAYGALIHPDDQAPVWNDVQAAVREKRPFQLSYRIIHRDGALRWVWEQGRGVFSPAGELMALEGFISDVTEHHQAEEAHRRLESQILQTQKLESLGLMAGGIAHDFNNLLMTILGNADLTLSDLPPESPVRENVRDIGEAAHRAADLCRQLLAYSGRGRFRVEPLNLSGMVQEMGQMLNVSVSKKITLVYHLAEHLPAIEADSSQVHQIIMNLILNASEAIGDQEGTVVVTTGSGQFDPIDLAHAFPAAPATPDHYVFLDVTDTGCGIDSATLPRVFDPFFTTKFTGRGLGLAAVLGIVRGHKGCITVTSQPGHGTTFRVYLPASGKEAVSDELEPAGVQWKSHGTVLLVDDEEGVRATVTRMLERCGFTVLEAADGRDAIRFFEADPTRIRCVLLDLTMPHMDGAETFRELARIRPDVRVVISSGYDKETLNDRFPGRGPVAFIHKPYTLDALVEVLHRVLGDS